MFRALDTKPQFGCWTEPCRLTFDDVYIIFAQRKKSENYTEDYLRSIWLEVSTAIMTYINLPYVPCGLRSVVTALMIDLVNYYDELMADLTDPDYEPVIDVSDVSSVQIGDTSAKLGGTSSSSSTSSRERALNSHTPDLDSLLFNYQHLLNQFRSPIPWRR